MKFWMLLALLNSTAAFAADPLANTMWRSYDDQTGALKGVIQFREINGSLEAQIIESYVKATTCAQCPSPQTNHPIVGLKIISGLKPIGSAEYANGEIIEPKTGRVYRLNAKLTPAKTLELRGFLGISLLGRTQIWQRHLPK
jgi:uncharacterized protein (DUF2147 family)